jgi:hypothetical protein
MAFAITGWIGKRNALGKIPTTHTWPHLLESSSDYKLLKKCCAKHFQLDLDNKSEASEWATLFPTNPFCNQLHQHFTCPLFPLRNV